MKYLCSWARRHQEERLDRGKLFNEYFSEILKANSKSWSCQCPQSAKVMGTRIMTDWIGSKFAGRNNTNFDMYENDEFDSTTNSESVPSVWDALQQNKPKIIYFTRNIMDEIVSRKVASATKIFHVKTDKDEKNMQDKAKGIRFEPAHAANELLRRIEHRSYISSKLASSGLDVLQLSYEFCMADKSACLNAIESFLGVDSTIEYNFAKTRKSIQGNITEVLANTDEIIQFAAKKDILNHLSTQWQNLIKKDSVSSLLSKKKKVVPGSAWRTYPMNFLEQRVRISDVFDHRAIHQVARAHHDLEMN